MFHPRMISVERHRFTEIMRLVEYIFPPIAEVHQDIQDTHDVYVLRSASYYFYMMSDYGRHYYLSEAVLGLVDLWVINSFSNLDDMRRWRSDVLGLLEAYVLS